MFRKAMKILSVNSAIFLLLIIGSELGIKIWKKEKLINLPSYAVPRIKCNYDYELNTSHLYSSGSSITKYKRDEDCYRSRDTKKIKNKSIILTIGGSTTDQLLVDEGDTFQDILDQKSKGSFDAINGGVAGQSSAGHLYSLKKWHSIALKGENVKAVIYYIGVNDRELSKNNISFNKSNYSFKLKTADFLQHNSRLYVFLRNLYAKNITVKRDIFAAHDLNVKLKENGVKYKSTYNNNDFPNYEKGIKDLINKTSEYFKDAKIFVVQQQIPGCHFKNKSTVFDYYISHNDLCLELANTYLSMDYAISKLEKEVSKNIILDKMYLRNILTKSDLYDALHTNKYGSKKIGEYLYTLVN